ncbi:MAG: hypothetical protein JRM80_04395 [Nitrososphaerota archaeon]|nr:hypothetical protein [Nitrososphaerota archaeon]
MKKSTEGKGKSWVDVAIDAWENRWPRPTAKQMAELRTKMGPTGNPEWVDRAIDSWILRHSAVRRKSSRASKQAS